MNSNEECRVIVFHGRIPSKKNCQKFIPKGKRVIIAPSQDYVAWERKALTDDLYGIPPIPWRIVRVEMHIYAPDLDDADSSNKWESIADCMVKAGVIHDDNWFVLPDIRPIFYGLDRENPRIELYFWDDTEAAIARWGEDLTLLKKSKKVPRKEAA